MTSLGAATRNEQLDTWLAIDPDGTVLVRTGKVELGQGLRAAIARIAADELELRLEQVRVETGDSATSPDEEITAGSMSMMYSGTAVRQAAAEARAHLLELAASAFDVPVAELRLRDGAVVHGPSGRTATYGELMGGEPFDRVITGEAAPLPPERHRLVGRPGPRPDLEAIVTGTAVFVHDLAPPGLLHGRVVRPANPGAIGLEGVQVVRNGSFVGVLAEREEDAVAARERLLARSPSAELEADVAGWLREQPTLDFPVVDGTAVQQPVAPYVPVEAAIRLRAAYTRPFQMHASIGPSAALAQWEGEQLTVWSHTQGPRPLRDALADVFRVDPEGIRVIHVPGAGCYGHNGADDVALDAALLAREAGGRPVLVKWMRDDEHLWEPYGPPAVVEVDAALDGDGRIVDWNLEVRGLTHSARPYGQGDESGLVAAWHLEEPLPRPRPRPLLAPEVGLHRNATPIYTLPRVRVVKRFVESHPLRTSSTRALGAYANVFAIESMMDELAAAVGADPLEFRLRHLDDERASAVLEAAADAAGWPGPREDGRGLGIGLARYKNAMAYAAVVAAVRVDDETAAISVERFTIAADAGEIVDPDGLANQLEGGAVQSASWTLVEEVRLGAEGVESRDWESYPILTFPDAPEVETVLLDRPGFPFLGAGEATQGPTAAAIANAVHAAVGLRLRDIPFTPERVRAAAAQL